METSILNKFLMALAKTKDALLDDLENEYISIRKIAEDESNDYDSASDCLVAAETVINAVFERIGFDITNYKSTQSLVDAVEGVFNITDGIADDVKAIADDPADVSKISETVLVKVKDVISLIETFKNIKYDEIKKEFADTPYEDIAKTLGRRLLDHILISLLRNMRSAFDDEIEYCRILARNISADISSIAATIEGSATALLKDAEDRAHELAGRLGDEVIEIRNNVEDLGDDIANSNIYIKASRTLSCIYAVLDFLGLMGSTTIEFKVPAAVVDAIKKAKSYADKAVADLGPILEVIGVSPTTFDNVQKQLTSASGSAASLTYPITIDTVRWESLKELFTKPMDYIKKMYHVENYDEATDLLTKIMELVRVFNPEIPDFASIKNMLISLVRKIEDRVLTAAKEVAGELWKKVEPFVMFIKMMIELLEQVADKVKDGIDDLLAEFRSMLAMLGKELDGAFAEVKKAEKAIELSGQDLVKYAKDNVAIAGGMAEYAWNQMTESAADAYGEFKKDFGKIGLGKYLNFDEGAIHNAVEAYAEELRKETGKEIKDAEIVSCVKAIREWFDSTTSEIYRFISPAEWFNRFDAMAEELEKVFKEDISAVTSLVSANGARKLAGNFKGTLKDTFSKIDISDYIKIITTAVDEVAIPNPESYYDEFKDATGKCFTSIGKIDVSSLWKVTERKLLTPLLGYLKDLVINALSVLMNRFLTKMLAERGEEIKALRNFMGLVEDMKDVAKGNTDKAITLVSDGVVQAGKEVKVVIDSKLENCNEYINWISWTIIEIINLSTKSPELKDILRFIQNFYSKLPAVIKNEFFDLFPAMPENGLTDYVKSINYTLDVDSRFFCATLLNLEGKEKGDVSEGSFSTIIQICIFVGEYDNKPAVYFIPVISAKGKVEFFLGNNVLTLELTAELNKVVKEAVGDPNVSFNLDFTDDAEKALPATGGEPLPDDVKAAETEENGYVECNAYEAEDLYYDESEEGYEFENYDRGNIDTFGNLLADLDSSIAEGQSLLDFFRRNCGNEFATREDMLNASKQWKELYNGKL